MSKLRLVGTQKLQVVLSGAATASRVTVSYMDFSATGVTGGTVLTVTNGATPVDICGAPAAGTTRQIDHIKLVAKAAMTPTFSVNDGSAEEWDTVTLASGDVYEWASDGSFVKDSSGNKKMVIGGAVAATTLSVSGASTLAAVTASGLITANAGLTVASGQTLTLTGATVAGVGAITSTGLLSVTTAPTAYVAKFGGTAVSKITIASPAADGGIMDLAAVNAAEGANVVLRINGGLSISAAGAINAGSNSITGGAISGTTAKFTSLGAFAASDKYVIVDASGNFHISALGPAS